MKKSFILQSALVALNFNQVVNAGIPDGSLASCWEVASLFDNTCDGVNDDNGEEMSCTGAMKCPGTSKEQIYTTESPCKFTRKLCVTCYVEDKVVRVKVNANGMPNHCFNNSNPSSAKASEMTWTVNWNPDVSEVENYRKSQFDTAAKTDEILCDIQRTAAANMSSKS